MRRFFERPRWLTLVPDDSGDGPPWWRGGFGLGGFFGNPSLTAPATGAPPGTSLMTPTNAAGMGPHIDPTTGQPEMLTGPGSITDRNVSKFNNPMSWLTMGANLYPPARIPALAAAEITRATPTANDAAPTNLWFQRPSGVGGMPGPQVTNPPQPIIPRRCAIQCGRRRPRRRAPASTQLSRHLRHGPSRRRPQPHIPRRPLRRLLQLARPLSASSRTSATYALAVHLRLSIIGPTLGPTSATAARRSRLRSICRGCSAAGNLPRLRPIRYRRHAHLRPRPQIRSATRRGAKGRFSRTTNGGGSGGRTPSGPRSRSRSSSSSQGGGY